MAETLTHSLPVLPIPSAVLLPGIVVTITLDSDEARSAVAAAKAANSQLVVVPQIEGRSARIGVVAEVEQVGQLPTGGEAAIIRTLHRARLGAGQLSERGGLWLEVDSLTEARISPRTEAQARELRVVLEEIAALRRSRRLPEILRTVTEPGALADAATAWSEASADHKLTVLEATEVGVRVELVLHWAREHLGELQVTEQIRNDVTEGVDKQQREYLLRQQMAAIRRELGETDGDVASEYRSKADAAALPDAVRVAVDKELDRLERAGQQNPEQGWIRTWLDRVLALPWGKRTDERLDLPEARRVLDGDHHGLDDVKQRIIELLAVRKLRDERGLGVGANGAAGRSRGAGAILALVGPPGVGKTSLGESVARAMGREFVRVSLGGVRDEVEIRGHRRTYVGAQPGRIVRAITEAGTMNPVVLLDEVDKLTAGGWSGDPTAALLEVLDPAQNHTFRDHYLEVELDLSDVVFIATANTVDTIPGPLLDRMEVVRLDGYTEDEKVFIARNHLLPRQRERAGLRDGEVVLDDDAIRRIIAEHTRESGVRSLERELAKMMRKVATTIASTDQPSVPAGDETADDETPSVPADMTVAVTVPVAVTVGVDDVPGYLGRAKVHAEVADRTSVPGVVTGLAVTGTGGDVLLVEASASDGEPGLTLTGQLGDVMKESAQIALSHVRANRERYGVSAESLGRRFHLHVPAGAVPKDGPSAGVTMTTALVSLLSGRAVKPTIGMTGEITLQGKVLPIGGVKQKVLAAHRAGLTEVVLPRRNEGDLDDVPAHVRSQMTFHLADTVDDVLAAALS